MMPPFNNRLLLWLFTGLALLFYVLPWVVNPGAGLTIGGYDLAEWISLSPMARTQSPALLTSFLLRLPLLALTWIIALHAPAPAFAYRWWGYALVMMLLVLVQIPPLEIAIQPDDINYRQQALLAGLSLVGGMAGLSERLNRYCLQLTLLLAVVTGAAAVAGLLQAQDIMRQYKLPAETGIGAIGLAVVFVLLAAVIGYNRLNASRAAR
jgi:hypothetical protein